MEILKNKYLNNAINEYEKAIQEMAELKDLINKQEESKSKYNKDTARNIIDQHNDKIEEYKEQHKKITEDTKEKIREIKDGYIEAIQQWNTPREEDLKALNLLKLDLNNSQLRVLAERYKDNPIVVTEIKKQGDRELLNELEDIPTAKDKIENVNTFFDLMNRAIENNKNVWARSMESNKMKILETFNDTLGSAKELEQRIS